MHQGGWFLLVAGFAVALEFLMPSIFGQRSAGTLVTEQVSLIANPRSVKRAIGVVVADRDAADIYGAATTEPECSSWEQDDGGCDLAYTNDNCPEDFDTFHIGGCFFCDYLVHKSTATRECSAGNAEYVTEGSCSEGIIDSLTGCVVK